MDGLDFGTGDQHNKSFGGGSNVAGDSMLDGYNNGHHAFSTHVGGGGV